MGLVLLHGNHLGEASHPLFQTLPCDRTSGLNVPEGCAQLLEAEDRLDSGRVGGVGQVLLVGQHQDGGGPSPGLDAGRLTTLVNLLELKLGLLKPLGLRCTQCLTFEYGGLLF